MTSLMIESLSFMSVFLRDMASLKRSLKWKIVRNDFLAFARSTMIDEFYEKNERNRIGRVCSYSLEKISQKLIPA